MKLTKRISAWIKVLDTVKSCLNFEHLDTAFEMILNYEKLYSSSKILRKYWLNKYIKLLNNMQHETHL
jgi:hypothetical protein